MRALLLALLLPAAAVGEDLPNFLRKVTDERDVQGLMDNDRSLAASVKKVDLTAGGTVAGSLTVSGYLAVAGDIIISGSGNGISFPDGTTQTTAAQTGDLTVGPTVNTSTSTNSSSATVTADQLVGGWQVVATTAPAGSSVQNFTGIEADTEYMLVMRLKTDANTTPQMRFNGDAGASAHKWAASRVAESGVTGNTGDDADSECHLVTEAIDDSDPLSATFYFWTLPGDSTRAVASGRTSVFIADSTVLMTGYFSCHYDGSSSVSSVSILTAGVTGRITLMERVAP